MRSEIVDAIKALLTETEEFETVCGMHSDKPSYPLVRVWYQGAPKNLDDSPQARIVANLGIQIETILKKDLNGDSIDGPLYDLVDVAFNALHNVKIDANGIQPLIAYDSPGMDGFQEKTDGGPAIYLLTVTARVIPESFSLT